MTLTVLYPTARLPPIKTLNDVPLGLLHEAVQYLQIIYNPEVHTSRRIFINNNHGTSPAPRMTPTRGRRPIHDKAVMESSELESIRVDAFEQAYVVRWLTALVAQKTTLHDDVEDNDNENDYVYDHDHHDQNDAANIESLVHSAAALLAICAGAASAGTRTRTYAFCGVRVQLTDLALRNDDFGSVGAQTWGSACVLAEMITEAPARFGLYGGGICGGTLRNDKASVFCHGGTDGGGGQRRGEGVAAIRVLELGAGTGLVSLTIAKILETTQTCGCSDNSRRRAEIVASDFYPPALENLRLNIQRNFASTKPDHDHDSGSAAPSGHDLSISAHFLNWEEEATDAADSARALESPFDVPFDEVFGADIVYELEHASWIKACLRRFLGFTGRFHLVIPLREGFAHESATIERVFPRVEDMHRVMEAGPTLCIAQREDITCEGPDGKGEVEYVHYTIQWAVCGDRGERGYDSAHEFSKPLEL